MTVIMREKPLILVADDEEDMRDLVCFNLQQSGFETVAAVDGMEAFDMALREIPDVVILDVMMPGRDGFRVCEMLRANDVTMHIRILILTARGDTQDRITGLQTGADDYMSKPFNLKELILRVRALLRRTEQPVADTSKLKAGPFEFDLPAVKMSREGEVVPLTLIEFKLLHLLASRQGEVVERDVILRDVWGYTHYSRTRTLDTHVKRLREKLGSDGDWLHTARGIGYVFAPPVGEQAAALVPMETNGVRSLMQTS